MCVLGAVMWDTVMCVLGAVLYLCRRGECGQTADQVWSAGSSRGLCHRQLVS